MRVFIFSIILFSWNVIANDLCFEPGYKVGSVMKRLEQSLPNVKPGSMKFGSMRKGFFNASDLGYTDQVISFSFEDLAGRQYNIADCNMTNTSYLDDQNFSIDFDTCTHFYVQDSLNGPVNILDAEETLTQVYFGSKDHEGEPPMDITLQNVEACQQLGENPGPPPMQLQDQTPRGFNPKGLAIPGDGEPGRFPREDDSGIEI